MTNVENDPTWLPAAEGRSRAPMHLHEWLFGTDSLTRRLVAACEGRFAVRVISEIMERPFADEGHALGLAADEEAFVRQVHLACDERAWVYARTVIPRASLEGPVRRLTQLGNRSLGEVLFSDPSIERGAVEVICLAPHQPLFTLVAQGLEQRPSAIWGRRSVFRLEGLALLVSEFFLPALNENRDARELA